MNEIEKWVTDNIGKKVKQKCWGICDSVIIDRPCYRSYTSGKKTIVGFISKKGVVWGVSDVNVWEVVEESAPLLTNAQLNQLVRNQISFGDDKIWAEFNKSFLNYLNKKSCECGSEKHGWPHLDFCPKYTPVKDGAGQL